MKISSIDNGKDFDYGMTSEDYAKYRDIYPHSMYEKLIFFGIGKNGQSILDIGSGTCVLPINLYDTGAHFMSMDISAEQIKEGKKRAGNRNIDFKVGAAESTGFPDSNFDVVTAVQCFHYFDAEKASNEFYRILKPHGKLCVIFMDWVPEKSEEIAEMEALVLKYNPYWNGAGFSKYRYSLPSWTEGKFDIDTIHSYNENISFSKEAWIGRVRTCRGVGASLSREKALSFENEYRQLIEKRDEPLRLAHQIHIEIYRKA